jgi:hypothetical protein
MFFMKKVAILYLILAISSQAAAHHATSVAYDTNNLGTIEGTVTDIFWRNPHIVLTIERILEDGSTEIWKAESGSTNSLERINISRNIVNVGDHVVLLGALSRRGLTAMAAYTMTLDSGREIPLWPFRAASIGWDVTTAPIASAAAEASELAARGIFRIWSRTGTGLDSHLPFTPAALAARETWDPLADDPALRCIPPGMPVMMNNPYPIEFIDEGDAITLRLEEWDGVRTIHMPANVSPQDQAPTSTGYSVGRWENNTLVVTTMHISERFFDDLGTPQSPDVEVVERFILNEAADQLDYRVVINDSGTFTEPATQIGVWFWNPGEEIKPFQCALLQG